MDLILLIEDDLFDMVIFILDVIDCFRLDVE